MATLEGRGAVVVVLVGVLGLGAVAPVWAEREPLLYREEEY